MWRQVKEKERENERERVGGREGETIEGEKEEKRRARIACEYWID